MQETVGAQQQAVMTETESGDYVCETVSAALGQ